MKIILKNKKTGFEIPCTFIKEFQKYTGTEEKFVRVEIDGSETYRNDFPLFYWDVIQKPRRTKMDNQYKIEAGKKLVDAYWGASEDSEDFVIFYLIADVLHYAKSQNLDILRIIEKAQYHYRRGGGTF